MRRVVLLLALLLASGTALRAQRQGARHWVPYAGLSGGMSSLPEVFQGCAPGDRLAAEARFGVGRGPLALEARAVAMGELAMEDCAFIAIDPFVPTDGIYTLTHSPYGGDDGHLAGDVRLRLAGPRAFPVVVSAGAGWLWPTEVPYLLAAAGVRFGGRVRLAVDAERDWYRAEKTEITSEWKNSVPVRLISREEKVEWLRGVGVRVGLEVPFR